MKVTIQYYLSETGRKASILAGGDGQRSQTVEVKREDPSFTGVASAAKFVGDVLTLNTQCQIGSCPWHVSAKDYDTVPTVAELLADELARIELVAAEKVKYESEQAAKKIREEAEDAAAIAAYAALPLSERVQRYHGIGAWEVQRLTLRHKNASDIPACQEAEAECERLRKIDADAVAEKKRLAAVREQERRAALGMEADDMDLDIEDGALTESPVWESHKRGKNWLAIITPSPSSPGGLSRTFAEKAKGASFYILPDWTVGDAVEFGADYYSGGGSKNAKRWFGVVVRIDAERVIIRKYATGKAACKAGEAFRKTVKPDAALAAAIGRVNGEGAIVPSDN